MNTDFTQSPLWPWAVFGSLFTILLTVDLISHRGTRLRSRASAITWTGIWMGVGLLFAFFVWRVEGGQRAGGLAAVLSFAAAKLLISNWIEVPPALSVGIIVLCIGASIGASIRKRKLELMHPS